MPFLREEFLKMSYFREQFWGNNFWKYLFWGSNFENALFGKAILKMSFWGSNFENFLFFREQIWKKYLRWLFIGIAADKDKSWLGWVLVHPISDFSFDSCKLRFQFWFIGTYKISILIYPNLHFSFDSYELTTLLIKITTYWDDYWLELWLIGM